MSFFKLLSYLPLRILYFFSSILSFLMYYVVRYRRKTSLKNITNSFPDKTPRQIKIIQKHAYRYISDSFFELIKAYNISELELQSRVTIENIELIKQVVNQNRSALLLSAHTAPTEWIAQMLHLQLGCYIDPVYKPAHSKSSDRFIFAIRSRYDATPIPYKKLAKDIVNRKKVTRCIAMLTDLAPRRREQSLTLHFLNQPTQFFLSIERIAKLANMPIFFIAIRRKKRGYFTACVHTLCEHPSKLAGDELTTLYARHVEDTIRNKPEAWLWTHRRWKNSQTA